MTQLCAISGPVRDRAGNLLSGQTVTFTYRGGVVGGDAGAVVPQIVTTTTSGSGQIAVSLYSGQYRVQIDVPSARLSFNIGVPDAPTAVFGDLIDQAPPITPDVLAQTMSARDTTVAATALAQAAADAAETARDVVLAAPASAFEIAVDGGFVGTEAEWLVSLVGPQGSPGPTGAPGADGADGTSVTILGSLANEAALPGSGSAGDGYLIDGDLYVWTGSAWTNVGTIQGPAGADATLNAALTSLSALGTTADRMLYTTALNTFAEAPLTSFARTLLDDTSAPAMRTTLGLGTASIATLTTSQTDTTAGRVLKVGDHGIGLSRQITNWDTETTEGSVWSMGSATGAPSASIGNFAGKVLRLNGSNVVQVAYTTSDTSARVFYRQIVGLTPRAWEEHHTSTSLPVTTHTRAFLATADDEASRVAIGIGTSGSLPTVSYTARASLPANGALPDGTIAAAEGLLYVAEEDATVTDKTGWLPFGEEKPGHWGTGTGRFTSRINYIKDRVDTGWYLSDFGAITDGADVSAIMEDALNAVITEKTQLLTLNPGLFTLAARVEVTYPVGALRNTILTIRGAGCHLDLPESNTTGGIYILKDNNRNLIDIRDLTLFSLMPEGTAESATNGKGLRIENSIKNGDVGWGANPVDEVVLDNIRIIRRGLGAVGRWSGGIEIESCWWPKISNSRVTTVFPGQRDGVAKETGDGILFNNCFSPRMVDCFIQGGFAHGIRLDETDATVEGGSQSYEDFQITGCYSVASNHALMVRVSSDAALAGTLKEVGGRVSGGHFDGVLSCINIRDRREVTISGPLLYAGGRTAEPPSGYADPNAAGIVLHNCRDVIVTGVEMTQKNHYESDTDATRAVWLTGDTANTTMDGNQFAPVGIGVVNDATGLGNTLDGTKWTKRGVTGQETPVKRVIDNTGLLRGGDAPQTRTPSLRIGGGSTGIVYSATAGNRTATFTKAGRHVSVNLRIATTNKGSLTGNLSIAIPDLPAPAQGGNNSFTIGFVAGYGTAARTAVLLSNGTLDLYGAATTALTDADLSNVSNIRISGTYETDE